MAEPSLQQQVARGVAWSGAAQALIAVADLVSQMLVLALWVPFEDYGIAMLAFTLYNALDTAADLGVAERVFGAAEPVVTPQPAVAQAGRPIAS